MPEICYICKKEYKDQRGLTIHLKTCSTTKTLVCTHCKSDFKNERTLSVHYLTCKKLKEKQVKEQQELLLLQQEHKSQLLLLQQEYEAKMLLQKKEYEKKIEVVQLQLKSKDTEILNLQKLQKESNDKCQKLEQEKMLVQEELNRSTKQYQNISSSCITALTSQNERGKTVINNIGTANIGNNTLQLQHFDPSIFTGKIDPPNVMVNSETQLIDYLKRLGFCNYYRVTDRSRNSLVWYDKDGTEVRDTNGSQIATSVLQALEPDIQKQIRWYEEQIEEISRRPNAYEYNDEIMEHGKKLDFCRAMIHPVQVKTLNKITKGISGIAKSIKDKTVDQIVERKETFNSFISLLQVIFFPNVDKWFNLNSAAFASFLEEELDDWILIEPGSISTKRIFVKNDEEKMSPVDSVKFSELLHEALSSATNDMLVESIVHLNQQLPAFHPTFASISESMFDAPCQVSRDILFEHLCKSRQSTVVPTCSLR